MSELHPDLASLAGLLGTWEGAGEGHYPTIDDFRYLEHVEVGHVGKPFLVYGQRTRDADTGAPLHAETGYLRVPGGGDPPVQVELVLAHPTGIVEVEQGGFDGRTLELVTTAVGRTSTAKPVRSLRRVFLLDGARLTYDLWMAHAETPETHHLHAELERRRG